MRIKRLELKNFRGFEELTINFPEAPNNVAVFVGVNGAGKTSVLEAITELLQLFIFAGVFPDTLYKNKEISPSNFNYSTLNIKRGKEKYILKLNFNLIQDFEVYRECNDISSPFIIHPPLNNVLQSVDGSLFEINIEPYTIHDLHIIREKIRNNSPSISYFPTERSIKNSPDLKSFDINLEKQALYENAFLESISFNDFFSWFRSQEDYENEQIRITENAKFRSKKLEAIRRAIGSFPPFFSNPRVQRQPHEEFIVEKNGEKLSISNLSHGERLMFAMVGDIARRLSIANPGLDDPLQGEGVVLIDEIELHLHPGWQRKIVPLLTKTFPNIQFIITTHSPVVLSTVKRENIFILEDFKLVEKTPHTYGRDINSILYQTFGVEERQPEVENEFRKLYALIDDPERVEEAKATLEKMKEKYGADDPELIRADMHLEFLTN